MGRKKYNHIERDLVINEVKTSNKKTIPEFVKYLNDKYNVQEQYGFIYHIIRAENLFSYFSFTKEHQTLNRLLENQELKTLLFKYNGCDLKLKDIKEIIKEELNFKITKYALKRIISYYRLNYITDRSLKYSTNYKDLSNRQKIKLLQYCKNNNIDWEAVTYKELKELYDTFNYPYLENLIFSMFNKYYK